MENFLTVEQYAMRAQLHPDSVRRQLREGRLRAAKKGRVWRIFESELQRDTPGNKADQSKKKPSLWQRDAERMAPIYQQSLDNGGELTAISTVPGDVYESSARDRS